jgi:hypothetical protein
LGVLALLAMVCETAAAQSLEQRGYLELSFTGYPQAAPGDSGRAIGEALFRYEPSFKLGSALTLHAALDARSDTHRQVERDFRLSYWDRSTRRPALDVRRLSATYFRGPVTLEIGKQFIRWGKTDILNPTDRFAPRDYLTVIDNEFLGVTAARLTLAIKTGTLDLVYAPRFTPSRIPLINQRWTVVPAAARDLPLELADASYPGGPQFGARWNHAGSMLEYSVSFFQGFNHLPLIEAARQSSPVHIQVLREYPKIRTFGGELAVPLSWFTLKAESAWFQGLSQKADEYVLYVIQAERQYREWLFIGGYAGERITRQRSPLDFAPDRGLAKAIVGRASLTIDTNRSFIAELVARQNGKGFYAKLEYSHALGHQWRATVGLVVIRGSQTDFLGQYRRNAFGSMVTRYSF